MRWQWQQLDHMQIICTLLQIDDHTSHQHLIMVALCNRADRYIFALWFLSFFFFFSLVSDIAIFVLKRDVKLQLTNSFFPLPNLSGRRLDVCHTSTHGVALVRI